MLTASEKIPQKNPSSLVNMRDRVVFELGITRKGGSMKIGKVDPLKLFYAVTLVMPIVYQAVVHLYGFVVDTAKEVKGKFLEAIGERRAIGD